MNEEQLNTRKYKLEQKLQFKLNTPDSSELEERISNDLEFDIKKYL